MPDPALDDALRHLGADAAADHAEARRRWVAAVRAEHPDLGTDDDDRARRHAATTVVNSAWETVEAAYADGRLPVVPAEAAERADPDALVAAGDPGTPADADPPTRRALATLPVPVRAALAWVQDPVASRPRAAVLWQDGDRERWIEVRRVPGEGAVLAAAWDPFGPSVRAAVKIAVNGWASRVTRRDRDGMLVGWERDDGLDGIAVPLADGELTPVLGELSRMIGGTLHLGG